MLKHWWLWTLLIAIIFGVSTGLKFLSLLIFGAVIIIIALEVASAIANIKDGRTADAIENAIIAVLSYIILRWLNSPGIAAAGVGISLVGVFLFCIYMSKEK